MRQRKANGGAVRPRAARPPARSPGGKARRPEALTSDFFLATVRSSGACRNLRSVAIGRCPTCSRTA